MRDTAFQGDGIVFGASRRLATARRIATLTMLHDFRGAFKHADLADASDIATVPFNAELEILIRVETLRIYGKFSHGLLLRGLGSDLSCNLLNLDDDELRGLQGRKSYDDVHDAEIDVVLRGSLLVTFDEIGVLRRLSLKCTLPKEVLHEGTDIEANLGPERFIVRLEDDPLRSPVEAFFDKQSESPDGNVFIVVRHLIGAIESAGSPTDRAVDREIAQAVDGQRIEDTVFRVRELVLEVLHTGKGRFGAGWGFPNSASPVGASVEPREGAAWRWRARAERIQGIGNIGAGKVQSRIFGAQRGIAAEPIHDRINFVAVGGLLGHIKEIEGSRSCAKRFSGGGDRRSAIVQEIGSYRQAQEIE